MSNIQFDYSTLSTSVSRSELGSIIGRHILENTGEYIEESTSEHSSTSEEVYVVPIPSDRYKLVYLTFGLLGIGTLLPWNFFITANDYWMHKFRPITNRSCFDFENKTSLQASFESYLAVANNVPYVAFLVLCTIYNDRFSKEVRVFGSLIVLLLFFGSITAFVEIDTDSWQIGFFSLTMLLVIAVSVTSAILQASVAGIASLLPSQYMHAMVLGQAIAGVFASLTQIFSLLGKCDEVKSALIYFFSADFVILLTLVAYLGIQKSAFFKYHVCSLKDTLLIGMGQCEGQTKISPLVVLKLVWPYAVSILLDFWVTIAVFPGLAVLIEAESQHNLWSGKLYLPIACFLLFNVSDICGRIVAGWMPVPMNWQMPLLIMCGVRVLFIPLFMLCNIQPRHHLPVAFSSDTYYISFITLLGFTNGYLVAVAMVNGIKSASPHLQETAGFVLATFVGLGLMIGSFSSYVLVQIV